MVPSSISEYGPFGVLLIRAFIALSKSIPKNCMFLEMNLQSLTISSSVFSFAIALKIPSNDNPFVARVAIYPIKCGNSSMSFADLFFTLIVGRAYNTKKVICPNPAPLNIGKRKANAAGWILTKIATIIPIMPPTIPDMRLKNTILHT